METPWLMSSYISKVQVEMHSALNHHQLKWHLPRLAVFIAYKEAGLPFR
jgi:hypothetical protein